RKPSDHLSKYTGCQVYGFNDNQPRSAAEPMDQPGRRRRDLARPLSIHRYDGDELPTLLSDRLELSSPTATWVTRYRTTVSGPTIRKSVEAQRLLSPQQRSARMSGKRAGRGECSPCVFLLFRIFRRESHRNSSCRSQFELALATMKSITRARSVKARG